MDGRSSLKKNSDFHRLYSRGKNSVSPYMVVYCMKNRDGLSRVGFTVSAKLGHAVTRNRIRRRLREIHRLNSHLVKPGYDIVIVARSKCINAEYRQIENAYLKCLGELNLI